MYIVDSNNKYNLKLYEMVIKVAMFETLVVAVSSFYFIFVPDLKESKDRAETANDFS